MTLFDKLTKDVEHGALQVVFTRNLRGRWYATVQVVYGSAIAELHTTKAFGSRQEVEEELYGTGQD